MHNHCSNAIRHHTPRLRRCPNECAEAFGTLVVGAVLAGLFVLTAGAVRAAPSPRVEVVVPATASKLERFAASELSTQFKALFGAEVRTVSFGKPVTPGVPVILLGSAAGNAAVREAMGSAWPKLSDQGHVLKSVRWRGRPALVVGGGSPVATLWAVYELGHHFGLRYLLTGDVPPAKRPGLNLEGIDIKLEPSLRLRTWRTLNDFAIGPEAWGLGDQKRLLGQVAKLKFNRVLLSVYPWQPFVDYEFRGVKKQTAMLWYGYRYPIDASTPGRAAFKGAAEFINPDFSGKQSYAEKIRAGSQLARGIIDTAHDLGMSAALSFSPLEFPREFAAVLPGARVIHGLENLTIGPGAAQPPDDPTIRALATTQIQAYLKSYPSLDALYLSLPEFPDWTQHYEASWKRIDARTGIGKQVSLPALLEAARSRNLIASGDRGARALQGSIAALDFFHGLHADPAVFRRADGRALELNVVQPDPALSSVLDRVLPPGVGALHLVDYTARRVAESSALLDAVPAAKVRSSLILTLADDNVGVLPQMTTGALAILIGKLRERRWDGVSTRYWMPGDLSPAANYLSRAAWDPTVTPHAAYDDLLTAMCGPGVAERVIRGFDLVENATGIIDKNDIGFTFPVPGMLMKHYTADPVPGWWKEVRDLYSEAGNEMYRGNQRSVVTARPFLLYNAKRLEFAGSYLTAVEEVRRAGIAKAAGKRDEQKTHLEKAVEALYGALSAQGEVVRDPSDRGVIAVLTEHAYRPLQKELEALEEQ